MTLSTRDIIISAMRLGFWVLLLFLGFDLSLAQFKQNRQESFLRCQELSYIEINKEIEVMKKGADDVKILASAKIDQNGGIVTIKKTGSPIDGLIVDIPEGALNRETVVTIGLITGLVKVRSGRNCGFTVVLAAQGIRSFHEKVSITMSYNPLPQSRLVIPYEIDNDNRLHTMDIGRIDSKHRKLVIYTFKPVRFTLVYP